MSELKQARAKPANRFVQCVLALILLVIGLGIGAAGVIAVRDKAYDFAWRSGTTGQIGPWSLSREITGTEHYRGGEAVRMGSGLICFGAMLLVWSIALLGPQGKPWGKWQGMLAVSSLLLLLGSVALIFPPWRIGPEPSSSTLYAAAGVVGLTAVFLGEKTRRAYGRWICISLLAGAIVLSRFSPGMSAAVILGILLAVALGVHVLMLVPRLRQSGGST